MRRQQISETSSKDRGSLATDWTYSIFARSKYFAKKKTFCFFNLFVVVSNILSNILIIRPRLAGLVVRTCGVPKGTVVSSSPGGG